MLLGADHLGHWSLTALLLLALQRTPGSRVVTVTSMAHHMGRTVDPANPHLRGRYGRWRAYGRAKLANFHFGLGLRRELERVGASMASLIAHPRPVPQLQAVSVLLLEAPSAATVNRSASPFGEPRALRIRRAPASNSPPRYRILRQMDAIFGSIILRFESSRLSHHPLSGPSSCGA